MKPHSARSYWRCSLSLALSWLSSRLLFVWAGLDLNGHVAKAIQAAEPALVVRRRQRVIRDQRDHGSAMAGTDLPQMQVGDAIAARLQPVANHGCEILVAASVEQHGAGGADQPDRPTADHEGTDDADRRIGP